VIGVEPANEHVTVPARHPAREVWAQAWPTVLTMLSFTVMQFVDSLMVSKVGPLEVAAQGNGGIWAFTPQSFLFGFLSVVNTFVAQSVGAGRRDAVAGYGWAGIHLAIASWLVVMIPWSLALPWFFETLGHSPELRALELQYALVLSYGSIAGLLGKAMSNFFFGLQRPRLITVAAIAGNVVNVLLNYVLIYGEQGLVDWGWPGVPGVPALGVFGAAIATVCGTLVEACVPLAVFLFGRLAKELDTWHAARPRASSLRGLLRLGWPVSVQFGNEIICWAIFMTVLVGHFGELHLTAGWSTLRYMHLSFMPAVGFSVATTALVGRYIGAGKPDIAANRAHWALGMAIVYMTVCGLAMAIWRDSLVGVFVDADDAAIAAEVVTIGSRLMICAAIFQTFDAVGIVYTGALRGAGDTLVPGVATIVLSWSLIVGLGAWLAWNRPEWTSVGPWVGASVYIIVYGVWMALRFERGAWRRIRLLEPTPAAR
jgi:MATE family multidrug resistance protein